MASSNPLQRLTLLVETLEDVLRVSGASREELIERAGAAVEAHGDSGLWLLLAVVQAELPERDAVIATRRVREADGGIAAVRTVLDTPHGRRRSAPIHVVRGTVVVDVHDTARTALATGIQRVARNTVAAWRLRHTFIMVGWDAGFHSLCELSSEQIRNVIGGPATTARSSHPVEIVIPWNSTYLLPELAIESSRTRRMQALAEYSGNATGVIGFDTVPLTSGETTGGGMPAAFARNLRVVAEMSRVAAISEAAAVEYRGWRDMLPSVGLIGPDVRAIGLASERGTFDDTAREEARRLFVPDELPLLLCVGSHEPRKNHLAVLAACELLWATGYRFRLGFIGGNGWRSESFTAAVHGLTTRERPITVLQRASDPVLWAAYDLATATVFPSLNEGFGLPVMESLLAGTPVVTSDFGSMKEIAEGGGAVLVDPRDDRDIARGIERLLFDDESAAAASDAARRRVERPWAAYAEELWSYFAA